MNVATHKDIIVTKYGIDHAIDIEISKKSVFKKKKILLARSARSQ